MVGVHCKRAYNVNGLEETMMSEIKDTEQHPNVEIAVKNFGPIAEANIDLRPLTVFVGPSNTGKTYFATLVYALHGIFDGFSGLGLLAPFELGGVMKIIDNLLHDLLEDSTSAEEEIQGVLEILHTSSRPFRLSDLPKKTRNQLKTFIKDSDVFETKLQDELKNCFNLNSISALIRLTEGQRNEMAISLKVGEEDQEHWNIWMKTTESNITLDQYANREMVIVPKGGRISPTGSFELTFTPSYGSEREWIHRSRYYLPVARSGIMQSHRIMASSLVKRATRVGLQGSPGVPTMSGVIADFMERIILYEGDKSYDDEIKHLAEMLETEVLAGQIRLRPSLSGYPDFCYSPQGIEEEMGFSHVSSMVSELAPIVLFLKGLVLPGDTFIIEEPEAHLHPGAQADMAVILARLVRAGVRVIITTHSDWLLQEISNLTLEGLLAEETDEPASWLLPDEVGVWHFQKDEPVKEIPFHPRKGISPEDYEDVAEGLYNRSVNLQQKFEKKKGEDERESS